MSLEIDVRACTAADWPGFLETFGSAFGFVFDEASRSGLERLLDPARQLVAVQDAAVVGTVGLLDFQIAVPGGEVPVGAVTLVGVRPSHRRRGILRRLMRRQLDDLHAEGTPLAVLWASETGIYQRFGYGLGTTRVAVDLARGWTGFLQDSEPVGVTRLVSAEEALAILPDVYERARAGIPGSFRREIGWWESRTLSDALWMRRGGGEMFRAVLEIDGRPEGYALYRFHGSWDDHGLPQRWLEVVEALGTSSVATREVWRFLFGVDIVQAVQASRLCQDHPLFLMLADPRRLRARLFDGIWLRVVDVASALTARRYGAEDTLTFELADPFCAWNAGTWTLEAGPNGASVRRSTATPSLRLSASELSAMYLGTVACSSLVRAGRVEEQVAGAARRADALFHSDVAPWCLDDF